MKPTKTELSPFPCRFDKKTYERLDRFTKKTGLSKAALVRHGVKLALRDFERDAKLCFED